MSAFQICSWSAATLSIVVALAVLLVNPRRRTNRFFMVPSICISAWLCSLALGSMTTDLDYLSFLVRLASILSAALPLAFDVFRLSLVQEKVGLRLLGRQYGPWLAGFVIVVVSCFSPGFLVRIVIDTRGYPTPEYGPTLAFFVGYWMVSLYLLVVRHNRALRSAESVARAELEFTVLGFVVAAITGVSLAVIIPVISGNASTGPFTPLSAVMYALIVAYGIVTHRILSVGDVLRRATAYMLLAAYMVVLYIGIVALAYAAIGSGSTQLMMVANILAALAVAFTMAPARGLMQQFANRLFINMQSMDVPMTMREAGEVLSSIGTSEELLARFSRVLMRAMGTDRIVIMVREDGRMAQAFPPPRDAARCELAPDDILVKMLDRMGAPIDRITLRGMRPSLQRTTLAERLTQFEAAIAFGVRSKGNLVGILLLGRRLSGRVFGTVEQDAIQVLCDQLGVALENAKLYTEVQNSSIYNHILVNSLASGVIAAGADRRITVLNAEAERITGLSASTALGASLDILPAPIAQAVTSTLDRQIGLRDETIHVARLNGHDQLPIRLSSSTFHSHKGELLGALLVFNDMTMVRRLEEQVRRTDRLASLGTLSAGMAHEIKNPLVSIKTFTELLPERYDDQEFRETFSGLMREEVRRIDSIVNRLLKFARPAPAVMAPLHLHDVLSNALHFMEEEIRRHNVTLVREFNATDDLVLGDAELLRQAVVNFVLNALEAMDSRGILTVMSSVVDPGPFREVRSRDGVRPMVRISIRDTGKGIAEQDLTRIFDPFFSTKGEGTGLGLSVSHGIIQEHNALIDVESDVGKGTVFHIMFPLLANEERLIA